MTYKGYALLAIGYTFEKIQGVKEKQLTSRWWGCEKKSNKKLTTFTIIKP